MTLRRQIFSAVVMLAVAGMCMLPVTAQQKNQAHPADQTQAQSSQPAQASATQKPPLTPQIRQGFWGRLNPFARKKYVQNQVAPIRDRLNELDGLSADNAKSIAALDAANKAALAKASAQAQQANDEANAATQQVQQTSSQANQLDQQVASVNTKVQGVDQYHVAQQAVLHFKPGPAQLNAATQQELDSFLQNLNTEKGYVVEVTAYSTRTGPAGDAVSMELANSVVRYLVLQREVPLYRIFTMGMGSAAAPVSAQMAEATPGRRTRGGTVEIKILKNSLASNSGS